MREGARLSHLVYVPASLRCWICLLGFHAGHPTISGFRQGLCHHLREAPAGGGPSARLWILDICKFYGFRIDFDAMIQMLYFKRIWKLYALIYDIRMVSSNHPRVAEQSINFREMCEKFRMIMCNVHKLFRILFQF